MKNAKPTFAFTQTRAFHMQRLVYVCAEVFSKIYRQIGKRRATANCQIPIHGTASQLGAPVQAYFIIMSEKNFFPGSSFMQGSPSTYITAASPPATDRA